MPSPPHKHNLEHLTERHAWLRAAVLGANDGIISTACLLAGFIGASASTDDLIFAGIAAILAGSLSMAAGEAVSVASQADAEQAELEIEAKHLKNHPELEEQELTEIYQARGLNPELANQVAKALMTHDALGAHARDELGLSETTAAKPLQAAFSSALSFVAGSVIPFFSATLPAYLMQSREHQILYLFIATMISLIGLGYCSAILSKAPRKRAVIRIFSIGLVVLFISLALGEGTSRLFLTNNPTTTISQ